jgi:14-3-3 protein epsilon
VYLKNRAHLLRRSLRHPTDVIQQVKELIYQHSPELTIDERNLLSVAYKNVTNTLRNSWRSLDGHDKAELARSLPTNYRHLALIRGQKRRIEQELTGICKDIVKLLDSQLIPAAQAGEETVFYMKM